MGSNPTPSSNKISCIAAALIRLKKVLEYISRVESAEPHVETISEILEALYEIGTPRVDEADCILVDTELFSCIGLLRETVYLLAKGDLGAVLPALEASKIIKKKLSEIKQHSLSAKISGINLWLENLAKNLFLGT